MIFEVKNKGFKITTPSEVVFFYFEGKWSIFQNAIKYEKDGQGFYLIFAELTSVIDKNRIEQLGTTITTQADFFDFITEQGGEEETATTAQDIISTIATTSGSVTAGAYSVAFLPSDNFIGTINGVTRTAGRAFTITAKTNGTLNSIPYTITAGSITIDKTI